MSNAPPEKKTIAAAIQERKAWETLETHVKPGDFTEQGTLIWREVGNYYKRDDGARACDIEILSRRIGEALANKKHKATFEELLVELGQLKVSPSNVVHDFVEVKKGVVGDRLATALLQAEDSKKIRQLVEDYLLWDQTDSLSSAAESQIFQGTDLSALFEVYNEEELIKLWPTALNRRLDGGLLRGHHVVIFARPEMGKTMFLVNAMAGFLSQNLTVLYVGNEDPISDIVLRVVCRLTKLSKVEVLENPEKADTLAREKGYSNIILAGLAPGSPREIEDLVKEYQPDVLCIDQLRNLRMKEDQRVVQLEQAATAARNIGKKHNVLVLSVTQAGDSASGKAILDMGDVDGSNTGIPAQADVMVGIGATQDDEASGRRVLSLPKNKRSGSHEFVAVRVDPTISRITGVD